MLARQNFIKEKKLKLKRESLRKYQTEFIDKSINFKNENNKNYNNVNNNNDNNNNNNNNNNNDNDKYNYDDNNNNNNFNEKDKNKGNNQNNNENSKSKRKFSINISNTNKFGAPRRSSFLNSKNFKTIKFNKNPNVIKEMLDSDSSKQQTPKVNISEDNFELGVRRKSVVSDFSLPSSLRRFSKKNRESVTTKGVDNLIMFTDNQNNENVENFENNDNNENNENEEKILINQNNNLVSPLMLSGRSKKNEN
jgi:hypothetical protein